MTAIHETAYPRIKTSISEVDLSKVFTPSSDEMAFSRRHTKSPQTRLCFLILLKVFQRLGYFLPLRDVPSVIINHITETTKIGASSSDFEAYETNGYRYRHIPVIRAHLGVLPFTLGGSGKLIRCLADAAQSKDDIADLINCGIETLIAERFELPAFSTLLKAARKVRHLVNKATYLIINSRMTTDEVTNLEGLFTTNQGGSTSFWDDVKHDPGPATQKNMTALANRLTWLQSLTGPNTAFEAIPYARYRRFVAEGRSLDCARMQTLGKQKKLTLAAALVHAQTGIAHDDLADMYIKSCNKMHWKAREKLEEMKLKNQTQTDGLIAILADITQSFIMPSEERNAALERIFKNSKPRDVLARCNEHMAYAGNNWLPLLPPLFNSRRQNFFRFLAIAGVRSSNQDRRLEQAVQFILSKKHSSVKTITTTEYAKAVGFEAHNLLKMLSWIPEKWWFVVTNKRNTTVRERPEILNWKMFEICVCTCVMQELKSGDLFIPGGEKFGDWRNELISDGDYEKTLLSYCQRANLPPVAAEIVGSVKECLTRAIIEADQKFPQNEYLSYNGNELSLKRLRRLPEPEGLKIFEKKLSKTMPTINIPQILMNTDKWIGWTKHFKPISGFEGRLDSPIARYVGATFCYGCNLGPTQTARSLLSTDRKQLVWVDQRHITEDALQQAIVDVINAYKRFELPKAWGNGSSASADGTKWDIYEKNLLSEYHIRYGGWGGIGYYHVADSYIALFSNFIACGVWEGIHILDGIVSNNSEIQPDTLHADTQGQSEAIFGLAMLLGIKLMPRIRNWRDLTFHLPSENQNVEHLQGLFTGVIDWNLIECHMPDMLRIAISVSRGRVMPSTILRRLNSTSRKSKLYFAFRELGRAVRTTFLLNYITEIDLRRKIQAATNTSESWNSFVQWVAFGGDRLRKSDRAGQHKLIRYNHLVANLIILHNVVHLTKSLNVFALENGGVNPEIISVISPYLTENINRFGQYDICEDVEDLDIGKINLSFTINELSHMC